MAAHMFDSEGAREIKMLTTSMVSIFAQLSTFG
jgi:hypothetical protein